MKQTNWGAFRSCGLLTITLLAGCGEATFEPDEADFEAHSAAVTIPRRLPSQPDTFGSTCLNAEIPAPNDATKTTTIHMSPTGSDANDGSTLAKAVKTLTRAHALLPATLTKDVIVLVHGGEYRGQMVAWTKVASNRRLHIKAAANEVPVFEGFAPGASTAKLAYLIDFQFPSYETNPGNITVEGLTIRHYVGKALVMRGGCNRFYNNKIHEIGSWWADCELPAGSTDWRIKNCVTDDCRCEGYGSIDLVYASKSIVMHNDIIDSANYQYGNTFKLIHPIYVYESDNNLIDDNYIRGTTGNPVVKFRDGASNNRVKNNYIERAGGYCAITGSCQEPTTFFAESETPSYENELFNNVATFSESGAAINFVDTASRFPAPNDPDQYTGKRFQGVTSSDEKVVATAIADVDGDGKPEVFVALNYPTLGFTKIVYSDGGGTEPNLRTVAYSSDQWQVTALAAGNFTGAGVQVVASFFRAASATSQISTGTLVNGLYTFATGTKLGQTSGSANVWRVSAMTAGKFGTDTTDKLITAAVINGTQYVFRGDGKTAVSGTSMPGVTNGTPLYSSSSWRIPAMTNGKTVCGAANALVTGFTWVGAGNPLNRVYCGDGVGTAVGTSIFNDASKVITTLAVGNFGGSTTPRLAMGTSSGTTTAVYLSSGTNLLSQALYSNTYWKVTALTAGRIDADTDDELLAAFDSPAKTEVHWGSGVTTSLGLTNGGDYYKNPL